MSQLVDGKYATEEQLKKEAARRMRELKLLPNIVSDFEKENKLYMSENGHTFELPKNVEEMVRKHEEEFKEKIYHVIHSFSNIGETYEMCYVSPYLEDWNYEKQMMKHNIVYAYVENISAPENSEAGSIGVTNIFGSLMRNA